MHAKSHDDHRFSHWSNIKGITSTILETIVLVLPVKGIYYVRH
jgi:hypothetical protein